MHIHGLLPVAQRQAAREYLAMAIRTEHANAQRYQQRMTLTLDWRMTWQLHDWYQRARWNEQRMLKQLASLA